MFSYPKNLKIILFSLLFFAILFTISRTDQKTKVTISTGNDGIRRVDILAGEYFFNPNHIVVKVNVPVEIKIRKKPGLVPHNIVANAPEAGIEIKRPIDTESEIIRFTPVKTEKAIFFCDKRFLFFKSHRKKGMEGTIEVIQ